MSADDTSKATVLETSPQNATEETKSTPISVSNPPAINTYVDNVNRNDLVETAIRFLQNPKVLPTPIENKRLFLAKKGLTESEIEVALKQSGSYNVSQNVPNTAIQQQQGPPVVGRIPNAETIVMGANNSNNQSLAIKIFKWISNIIFAGCVAFTAYKLLIKKFFFKTKSKAELNMERMLNENNQLQETVREMRNSLDALKQSVEVITNTVKQLNNNKTSQAASASDSDIKNEVQSIKSLLLNRSQFPGLPTVTPILPSWQLESKTSTINKKQESNTTLANTSELLINEKNSEIDEITEKSNDLLDSTISDDLSKSITNDTVLINNLKLDHDES